MGGWRRRAQEWGEELWQRLLRTDPSTWKDVYNRDVRDERRQLSDDPVPKAVVRALRHIDVKSLAEALENMPVRARGGDVRVQSGWTLRGALCGKSRPCCGKRCWPKLVGGHHCW